MRKHWEKIFKRKKDDRNFSLFFFVILFCPKGNWNGEEFFAIYFNPCFSFHFFQVYSWCFDNERIARESLVG